MNKRIIIVDGFGGDNAPLSVLEGCAKAVAELDVNIVLTGDEPKLRETAAAHSIPMDGMRVVHTERVITNDDQPTEIVKGLSDSSMAVGLKLLAGGEGDAFVSAGSTGALVVGSSLLVKRIRGVKRAALATILPSGTGSLLLLDVGANTECRPETLVQFAHMGAFYMKTVGGVAEPKVGLVNIGTEEKKGTETLIEAYGLLNATKLNFVGNIEGRDIPLGKVDVAVSEGFTGNIVLKTMEGTGLMMNRMIKDVFLKNAFTKCAALLVKGGLRAMKKRMDYTEQGGAPLLGISKPVIKAHGSSNGYAFYNAIRQAKSMLENDVVGSITEYAKAGGTEEA